jgi:hypothetical protein
MRLAQYGLVGIKVTQVLEAQDNFRHFLADLLDEL